MESLVIYFLALQPIKHLSKSRNSGSLKVTPKAPNIPIIFSTFEHELEGNFEIYCSSSRAGHGSALELATQSGSGEFSVVKVSGICRGSVVTGVVDHVATINQMAKIEFCSW
ncbi:hypothetical protein AMTRI_Chr12g274390 [Amborella trichopoda]